jgi:hypothetical protein
LKQVVATDNIKTEPSAKGLVRIPSERSIAKPTTQPRTAAAPPQTDRKPLGVPVNSAFYQAIKSESFSSSSSAAAAGISTPTTAPSFVNQSSTASLSSFGHKDSPSISVGSSHFNPTSVYSTPITNSSHIQTSVFEDRRGDSGSERYVGKQERFSPKMESSSKPSVSPVFGFVTAGEQLVIIFSLSLYFRD